MNRTEILGYSYGEQERKDGRKKVKKGDSGKVKTLDLKVKSMFSEMFRKQYEHLHDLRIETRI